MDSWCAPRVVRWDYKVVALLGALGVERSVREVELELMHLFEPWHLKKKELEKRVVVDATGRRQFMTTELGRNESKDVKGWRGDTVLHLCIRNGCSPVVVAKLLLSGADARLKNENGETARDVALSSEKPQIVRLLEEDAVRPLSKATTARAAPTARAPNFPRADKEKRPGTAPSSRPKKSLAAAKDMDSKLMGEEEEKDLLKENEKLRSRVSDLKAALERARGDRASSKEGLDSAKYSVQLLKKERDAAVAKAAKIASQNKNLEDKLDKQNQLKCAEARGLQAELGQLYKTTASGARAKRRRDLSEALLLKRLEARQPGDFAGHNNDATELRLAEIQALETACARLAVEKRHLKDRLATLNTGDVNAEVVANLKARRAQVKEKLAEVVTKLQECAAKASDPALDDAVIEAFVSKSNDIAESDATRGLAQICDNIEEAIQSPRTTIITGDVMATLQVARDAKENFERELAMVQTHVKEARLLLEPMTTAGQALRHAALNDDQVYLVGVFECDTLRAMEKILLGLSKSTLLSVTALEANIVPARQRKHQASSFDATNDDSLLSRSYADLRLEMVCDDKVRCRVDVNFKVLADIRHRKATPAYVELLETTGLSRTSSICASVDDDDFTSLALRRLAVSGRACTDCFFFSHLKKASSEEEKNSNVGALIRGVQHPTCFLSRLIFYGLKEMPSLHSIFDGASLRVEHLRLERCQLLEAGVPKSIARLAETLQSLEIIETAVNGPLPSEIGKLVKLRRLRIEGTGLSGAIPETLARCANLQRLELPKNRLTGEIPTRLATLSDLEVIDLSENELTGAIPADLSKIKSLQTLNVDKNQFYGLIPRQLCASRHFTFRENFFDYYEIICGRGYEKKNNTKDTTKTKSDDDRYGVVIPMEATKASASTQCKGNYGADMALVADTRSFYCSTYGDRYGTPETLEWTCPVPRGYVPRLLELHFVVDVRDPTRKFLAPTSVEADLLIGRSKQTTLSFRRAPEECLGDDILRLKPPPSGTPLFTTKDTSLRVSMRRPNAALGHYLGLRSVLLRGDALEDI